MSERVEIGKNTTPNSCLLIVSFSAGQKAVSVVRITAFALIWTDSPQGSGSLPALRPQLQSFSTFDTPDVIVNGEFIRMITGLPLRIDNFPQTSRERVCEMRLFDSEVAVHGHLRRRATSRDSKTCDESSELNWQMHQGVTVSAVTMKLISRPTKRRASKVAFPLLSHLLGRRPLVASSGASAGLCHVASRERGL